MTKHLTGRQFPLVPVVRVRRFKSPWHPHGTHSYMLYCEKGHPHRRKGSQGISESVRCMRCYYADSGNGEAAE